MAGQQLRAVFDGPSGNTIKFHEPTRLLLIGSQDGNYSMSQATGLRILHVPLSSHESESAPPVALSGRKFFLHLGYAVRTQNGLRLTGLTSNRRLGSSF